jgi:hypothetical protein
MKKRNGKPKMIGIAKLRMVGKQLKVCILSIDMICILTSLGSSMPAPQLPPLGGYPQHSNSQSQPGYGAPSPAMVDGIHKYVPSRV